MTIDKPTVTLTLPALAEDDDRGALAFQITLDRDQTWTLVGLLTYARNAPPGLVHANFREPRPTSWFEDRGADSVGDRLARDAGERGPRWAIADSPQIPANFTARDVTLRILKMPDHSLRLKWRGWDRPSDGRGVETETIDEDTLHGIADQLDAATIRAVDGQFPTLSPRGDGRFLLIRAISGEAALMIDLAAGSFHGLLAAAVNLRQNSDPAEAVELDASSYCGWFHSHPSGSWPCDDGDDGSRAVPAVVAKLLEASDGDPEYCVIPALDDAQDVNVPRWYATTARLEREHDDVTASWSARLGDHPENYVAIRGLALAELMRIADGDHRPEDES